MPVAAIPLGVAAAALALVGAFRRPRAVPAAELAVATTPDFALVSAGLNLCHDPAVLTDADGEVLSVNRSYRHRFPTLVNPLALGLGDEATAALSDARTTAL